MDDLDKERIKFDIEIIKLLTLLFITTGGGGIIYYARENRRLDREEKENAL